MDGRALARAQRDLLIALNACPELGRHAVCRLAENPAAWYRGDVEPISGVSDTALALARRVAADADAIARREHAACAERGAVLLTRLDPDYPAGLVALALPPPVLYVRGRVPAAPAAAIVGSRRTDAYGREVATLFGRDLAARGLTVVSGFARGVDAAAHRGALEAAAGRTVAVLGCGLDVDYPRGSRRLAAAVAERGAVVSEFPLGTQPLGYHFPIRNRIIAALAQGTLVVQGEARSGSLITARLALELGRDVWAVPGRIFDSRSAGPNTLIRDGALAVQHPRDIIESLPDAVRARLPADDAPDPALPVPPLAGPARRLLGAMTAGEADTAEALAAATGLGAQEVLGRLLELELAGWVRRLPGGSYGRRG